MTRFLLSLLIGAALLAGIPAQAFWQSRDSNYNVAISAGATYTGPGDVVSGATAWYGLRAYNAAYAATPGKSVNLRRASDNVACDVNVATTGGLGLTTATCNSSTQGGITPAAFAGTDATATCTLASTTATCTGASSTPHVGSTITGAGLTQPCLITAVGTFTAGAGTLTTSLAGTSTSCGTISVGETFTMTYGLFLPEAYDQTAHTNHLVQATAGNQPQLLPSGINSLPAIQFTGTQSLVLSSLSQAQPYSFSVVSDQVGPGAVGAGYFGAAGPAAMLLDGGSANQVRLYAGSAFAPNVTAANGTAHAIQGVFNGASSILNVDGTGTTGSPGAASLSGNFILGNTFSGGTSWLGRIGEAGEWGVGFSTGNNTSLCGNQRLYYGTPGSC